MAQAGYTPILIYASSTPGALPSAANLTSSASGAELAINYADGKLYFKNSSGVVTLLAGSSSGPAGGSNTQVQYNSSGVLAGVSGATTNGTAITFSTTNLKLQGSSTGVSSFASANSSATDYTVTFPAASTTIPVATQTLTFSGPTAARTITLPDANFTAARTDAAQTFTGVQTFSSNPVLDGGTANGVLYLNASKVATSGSALTFDGTNLGIGINPVSYAAKLATNGNLSLATGGKLYLWDATDSSGMSIYNASNSSIWFGTYGGSEYMRLTSTGLGIGTSSPAYKLNVVGTNGGTTGLFQVGISAVTNGFTINTDASNNIVYSFLTKTGSTGIYQDASGNLGIGTSSPAAKLDVVGSSSRVRWELSTASTYQASSNPAGSAYADARYDALSHSFLLSGGTGAKLDSSGNLGLGVTPSAWSASAKALQITSYGAALSSFGGGSTWSSLTHNAWFDGTNWKYTASSIGAALYQTTGSNSGSTHSWSVAAGGTAGNTISFTQAMTLDASGNLGIGQTGPGARLDVKGANVALASDGLASIGADSSGADIGGQITFKNSSARRAAIAGRQEGGDPLAGYLQFGTRGTSGDITERARIDSSGNLLVGTTDTAPRNLTSGSGARIGPSGQLELAGASDTNYINITAASGTMLEFRKQGPNTVGSISTNGTATAYNTSSDYRLKSNPQPLTGSGAFIDALQPKTWNWKADGSRGVGFIAHEVQEVSPGSVVGEKDGEQMQAMEYGSAEFIANIIAELQSLRQRVAELEGK